MRRLLIAAALFASACAGPERPVLEQFFSASRLRDRTALQKIATVIFEPRERGIVTTFEVLRVDATRDGRKGVIISAPVALPDGRTLQQTLVIALERDGSGRWLITDVREAGSPR